MLPRCYRFDGSTGMDLRPAAVLEAEDARRTELRRRHEPMAVTTRSAWSASRRVACCPCPCSTGSDSPTGKACIRVPWRPFRPILRDCMWIT